MGVQVTLKCGISFEVALVDELDVLTIKLVTKGASELFTVDMVFGNVFDEPYLKPFETQDGGFVLVQPQTKSRAYVWLNVMAGLSREPLESSQ